MTALDAALRRMGDETGALAVVTLLALLLFTTGALAGLTAAADLSLTAARARAAADAAALAAMATSPLVARTSGAGLESADARTAAHRVATANGARLVDGDDGGWPLRYRATVEVDPLTAWVRRIISPVRDAALGAVRPRGG